MKINLRLTFIEKKYIIFKELFQIYQSIIRSFIYVIFDVKSNIFFVILMIFRYAFNFIEIYYIVIKRIFHYLKKLLINISFIKIRFKN